MSSLTTFVNLLLGLSLGLLTDTYNWNTSHCTSFFRPLPSFNLHCISLYSCLLTPLCVPLLRQSLSLHTLPTPQVCFSTFLAENSRVSCSCQVTWKHVFIIQSLSSLKKTPRHFLTSTTSSSDCFCPFHHHHLQSHLTHHHFMLAA